jgi:class 3 adenylate cyclase
LRPHGLKEVANGHRLAVLSRTDREARLAETRRSETDRGVAGKGETFTWNRGERVEPPVRILVMNDSQRIVAARQAQEAKLRRLGGRDGDPERVRIGLAVGKARCLFREAGVDQAARVTQLLDPDLELRGGCCRCL